jgi:hypothetical protein
MHLGASTSWRDPFRLRNLGFSLASPSDGLIVLEPQGIPLVYTHRRRNHESSHHREHLECNPLDPEYSPQVGGIFLRLPSEILMKLIAFLSCTIDFLVGGLIVYILTRVSLEFLSSTGWVCFLVSLPSYSFVALFTFPFFSVDLCCPRG